MIHWVTNDKDITPMNSRGLAHGYWVVHNTTDGGLTYEGMFDNGSVVGMLDGDNVTYKNVVYEKLRLYSLI